MRWFFLLTRSKKVAALFWAPNLLASPLLLLVVASLGSR